MLPFLFPALSTLNYKYDISSPTVWEEIAKNDEIVSHSFKQGTLTTQEAKEAIKASGLQISVVNTKYVSFCWGLTYSPQSQCSRRKHKEAEEDTTPDKHKPFVVIEGEEEEENKDIVVEDSKADEYDVDDVLFIQSLSKNFK